MKSPVLAVALLVALAPAVHAGAVRDADRGERVSPARRIEPQDRDRRHRTRHESPVELRSIDGTGNHPDDPQRNASFTPLARIAPADYADGISSLAGPGRPSARVVSNIVVAQDELVANPYGTSDFLWQWGQFLDHDIDLSEGVDPPEPAPIEVPAGDPAFDPDGTGVVVIPLNRSVHDLETGTDPENPREQLNEITGWIDASNVYGSDPERAGALRMHDRSGRMLTSGRALLPDDDGRLPNATGGAPGTMFLAGDLRANEQVGLTALHTLFVREHNRQADRIRRHDPELDGDEIFERARRRVAALMQVITYEEFLPALLGPDALPPYRGYRPERDARILNEFSTAAFRFGHSALSPRLLRLDVWLRERPEGHLPLRDAFFSPDGIRLQGGIEPLLRGLAHQAHQRIDVFVVDDVRNFLFGAAGAGGFDLPALNVQRGRDHGLASYNALREAYGLARRAGFDEISSDPEVQGRLAAAYEAVDDVDPWVGGLAEDPVAGSQLGELFHEILVEQFTALRDGDRFWYENDFDGEERDRLRRTRLSDVIRRNTHIRDEIPDDVFHVPATRASGGRSNAGRSFRSGI